VASKSIVRGRRLLLFVEDGSRSGVRVCRMSVRMLGASRTSALHTLDFAGLAVVLPERDRTEVPGSVDIHREDIEEAGKQKEEAGDEWVWLKEMTKQLSTEQQLKNTNANKTACVIEAGNPFLEKRLWESSFRDEKNNNFHEIESNAEKGSEITEGLIGNARSFEIIAVFVLSVVGIMLECLDILCHENNIGNEDEQQADHRKCAKRIEEEELWLFRERDHGQQVVKREQMEEKGGTSPS